MAHLNSFNKVILMGHIGKEIEFSETEKGKKPKAVFTLITNEVFYKRIDGKKKFKTEYHRIVAWGRTARVIKNYGATGMQVHVEGQIRSSVFTDKSGTKKRLVEIHIDSLIFVGKKKTETDEEIPDQKEPDPF